MLFFPLQEFVGGSKNLDPKSLPVKMLNLHTVQCYKIMMLHPVFVLIDPLTECELAQVQGVLL